MIFISLVCRLTASTNFQLMASNVYVTFRLDPFYQTFLRAYFDQYELLFEFPKRNEFNILLEFLVMKQPATQKKMEYGDESFNVRLQNMEYKNVVVYNYISKAGHKAFIERVEDLFKLIFHKHVDQAIHRAGLKKKAAIHLFMDKYEMGEYNSDRLTKNYQRYENRLIHYYDRFKGAQRQAKYRKKNKKNLPV